MKLLVRLLICAVAFGAIAAVGYVIEGVASADDGDDVLGPGLVIVDVAIHHSTFDGLDGLRVRPGTTVRFVVHNRDPINHELIIGPAAVHQAHEHGTERVHPPVPGEVSVAPLDTGVTFYEFEAPGT
ncbi:MAG TPA: hypothetical protein VFX21_00765, partial [Acidimicrobiia bacterium]|nr:hypothetical protein [Acidimicrobiia bacterium]